jgi:methylamine--corrinoid protein Co-methyltransferase
VISLLDVAERAFNGPRQEEMAWNLGLFKKMQELTVRHRLQRPLPDTIADVDDAYCDALFDAAVDFLVETGVYCISTRRIIPFTEEEVRAAAKETPGQLILGEGRDTRLIRQRAVCDSQPTHINTGGHSAWSEALLPLPLIVRELTRIPRVGSIEGFNFVKIDGRDVHGTPTVVYAARRAVELVREGVRLAGRAGLRRSDGLLLSVLPDLKVESDLISAAIVHEHYGCYRVNGGAGGQIGGFCGDAYGAMIEAVARNLTAWLVYRDQIQYAGGVGTLSGARSLEGRLVEVTAEDPTALLRSLVVQFTLKRHTHVITYGGGWPQNGGEDLCSEEHLVETALASMRSTVLGHNLHLGETPPPTTVAWAAEVSDATLQANLTLPDLDELTRRIRRETLVGKHCIVNRDRRLLLYQDPVAFLASEQKCYDFLHQRPSEAFLAQKRKVSNYLQDVGLPVP